MVKHTFYVLINRFPYNLITYTILILSLLIFFIFSSYPNKQYLYSCYKKYILMIINGDNNINNNQTGGNFSLGRRLW